MDRILIVGAHAMDAEIMAGGIAIVAQELGIPVLLVHLTRGERGHALKTPEVFGKQLKKEMEKAAGLMGVRQKWPGFMAPLTESKDVEKWIEKTILEEKITLVITHWVGSWHPSHIRAHQAVVRAIRNIRQNQPALFFAENCEDLLGFQPEWLIPISTVYERWIKALKCYELFKMSMPQSVIRGEIPYFDYYTSITKVRGFYVNLQRTQALMCGKGELPSLLGGKKVEICKKDNY